MATMVQIKRSPDRLNRRVNAATVERVPMPRRVLREIGEPLTSRAPRRPSLKAVFKRIAASPSQRLSRPAADVLREERQAR